MQLLSFQLVTSVKFTSDECLVFRWVDRCKHDIQPCNVR